MRNIGLVLLLGSLTLNISGEISYAQNPAAPTKEVPPTEQLNSAIDRGDLATVKQLVEANTKLATAPVGRYGNQGVLSRAVANGQLEIVKYLLEKGADANQENGGTSVLSNIVSGYSTRNNWQDIADALLAKGADINRIDSSGSTTLFRTLTLGSSEARRGKIEWLVKNKADVKVRVRSGANPLEFALANPNIDIELLKVLLDQVDIKAHDTDGNTLLHLAVTRSNPDKVRLLIEKGVEINAQNGQGDTALHLIAPSPAGMLKILLDAGANPNLKNARGDLPLHIGFRALEVQPPNNDSYYGVTNLNSPQGYLAERNPASARGTIIAPLLDKTDITIKDQFGMSPLLIALLSRDQESRDLILKKAPKMDATTQLFDAVASGNTATVNSLLAQKPFLVYFRLPDGSTPLHVSALWGTSGVAQILLAKGADPNARNAAGQTPLHEAITRPSGLFLRRSINMVALLISRKANILAADQNGSTPLHRAVQCGEADLVATLIANKANVNVHDESGNTPLMLTTTRSVPIAIVNALLAAGAEVNARNKAFATPLSLAVSARRADIVPVLIAKGADVNYKHTDGRGLLSLLVPEYGDVQEPEATKEIFALLLAKGADPNQRNNMGTIANTLINNGNEDSMELLKLLLNTRKVPFVSIGYSGEPQSLLMQAVMYGRKGAIEVLLEAGADATEKDAQGRSLIQIVNSRGGNKSIIDMLKAKGAVE